MKRKIDMTNDNYRPGAKGAQSSKRGSVVAWRLALFAVLPVRLRKEVVRGGGGWYGGDMTAKMILEVLTRIGLALVAGVLIGIVPLELRRLRFASRIPWKIVHGLVALVALAAFWFYGQWLWEKYRSQWTEDAPQTAEYPTVPKY